MPSPRLITLTTDFGTRDAYVAAMKGVICGIAPDARLVDISHEVAPQDIMEAAYVLQGAARFYPPHTIHLVVVDPGVGTNRRAVALRAGAHTFVGPDNGLFPLLLEGVAPDEVVELDRPRFWRTEAASSTFHGRDIFAPVAAHLAAGRALAEVGSPSGDLKPLHWAQPRADDIGIRGWIVHVDHFGNAVTNVTREIFERHRRGRPAKCIVGNAVIHGLHATYGEVEVGEPLLLVNSSGFLEVAVNASNGAELLGIRRGDAVNVLFCEQS